MPTICYQPKRFSAGSLSIIYKAQDICEEYTREGFTLTLRQLYYQFVARGLIANKQTEYKRLGSIINDARLSGMLDWEAIEDRTRNLEKQATWDSPKDILQTAARQFKFDWWDTQPCRVEIWVEKEALVGVIERTAHQYRVPFFACRGYTSQSEAWRAGQRFADYNDRGQPVKVLHLGDHDPSGIDMTRDNDDRLMLFNDSPDRDIEVLRLALNYDQVQQYKPPPNPAKLTDSRATRYISRFGRESWELDALDPKVIHNLIATEIEQLIDYDAWQRIRAKEIEAQQRIGSMAEKWED